MYLHLTRYDKDVVDKKVRNHLSCEKGTFMKIIIINIQLHKASFLLFSF